jgi:hypothetical protein
MVDRRRSVIVEHKARPLKAGRRLAGHASGTKARAARGEARPPGLATTGSSSSPTLVDASRPVDWSQGASLVADWDRYFELFTLAPVGYGLLDLHGVIREVNEAAARLLGEPAALLVGRSLSTFIKLDERHEFRRHMRRVARSGEIVEAELTLVAPDGRLVPVHLSTRRSPRHDQPLCWAVIVDVSERQRLEEARRTADRERERAERDEVIARTRGEAKDRFIATLSHELRNPLAPALYAASYLAGLVDLPMSAVRFVEMIRRNVEFEARLIDDLLDVTRIGQGKLKVSFGVVDLNELVADCLATARVNADAKRLTLVGDLHAGRATVRGDQVRLRQVIVNLLSNAVKFTPPGGQVVVSTINDSHGAVRLTVADTGIGIDPQQIGGLFVPFEQMGRRDHGGLGLGLAISRGIIEAHQGRISAMSTGAGQGATFDVELATMDADDCDEASPSLAPNPLVVPSRRILVVEDHSDSAEMLRIALESAGHRVEVAPTLSAALSRLDDRWDLVVSDLGLPDGSGLDVARRARTLPHGPARLVALSGYGTEADRQASEAAGFDAHLVKPVLPSRILELLP